MSVHTTVVLLGILAGAFAQSNVRGRNYITIPANNNIYSRDLSLIRWERGGATPICKPMDRDFTIDLMMYDRISKKRDGTYSTMSEDEPVSGIGVEFQQLHESDQTFRTIFMLVFRNENDLHIYLNL
ncbi:uncharacterized protein [Argopecten irradians]|uniref:uncharacterized protein n=1 Tax=Argopecten irradians TaxID=31199 RepID=UPI00371EBD22